MAWSDAARAAALEARRLHADARTYDTSTLLKMVPQAKKTNRVFFAQMLKKLRAGGTIPDARGRPMNYLDSRPLMMTAVVSTRLRNASRNNLSGTHPYVKSRAYAKNQIAVNKALAKRSK